MEVKFPFYTDEAAQVVDEFSSWLPKADGSYQLQYVITQSPMRVGRDFRGQVTLKIVESFNSTPYSFYEASGDKSCTAEDKVLRAWPSKAIGSALPASFNASVAEVFRDWLQLKSISFMEKHFSAEDRAVIRSWKREAPMPRLSEKFTGVPLDPLTSEFVRSMVAVLAGKIEKLGNLSGISVLGMAAEIGKLKEEAEEDLKRLAGMKLHWFINGEDWSWMTGVNKV